MILPVILAGGSGTRLWPLSRQQYPKQFLPLTAINTMFQETVLRFPAGAGVRPPLVVCNSDHRFLVAEQLQEIKTKSTIILEPAGRNTAPAVAVAALAARADGDDPFLLVLPADHVIRDLNAFAQAVKTACAQARDGRLITFGIVPDSPQTGYGYIRKGASLTGSDDKAKAYSVAQFVEKPDQETASRYIAEGLLWNSGMFVFRASRFLEELEKFAPEMLACCKRAYDAKQADLDFVRLDAKSFKQCHGDSIDYAVMEKTDQAAVIPLACGWNDVGSWAALWEVAAHDEHGNVVKGNTVIQDSRNCYINASHRLVATVGLEDLIIVETSDAVLVAHREKSQEVKAIVDQLKREKKEEALLHRRVFRPWGSYEGVDNGERFQVKRITVKPGATLSHQMHYHRAEHWVVVSGTALITNGEKKLLLSENQSTFIPLGEKHRLENPGTIPLELIEVQSGSYLGEDDIVRFDDQYGRSGKG
ncbi:MAG: mannose-1-phosphate guanylyltransferase/mannose-6-phosphate isomerase [Deltaproteobacteria bacterium RIFOXYD12_FULL_50_9]|nr:MAG: mannose-1-phosphate guanylyltransferase/mannose-6-phosphate isomerase [Deltaproteobacteria bacterium RIFOXYD12_FULL_50_9]